MPRVKSAKNTSVKETKTKETKVKKTKSIKVDKKSTKVEKPKVKKTKKIVKSFTDEGIFWEASKIILRLIDEDKFIDYTRTFGTSIYVNKNKIGKKTKYVENKWGKITDIKEDENDLIFILEPILD